MDNVLLAIGESGQSVETKLAESITLLQAQIGQSESAFRSFSEHYSQRVSSLSSEQRALLESHRRVMEETANLPILERERDTARQMVELLLRGLIERCDAVTMNLENGASYEKRRSRHSVANWHLLECEWRS